MFAMRILAALQTGQIPVGGMTQSMRRWQPHVQLSMPATWLTSGLSYSVAVWARHRAVATAIRRLALHVLTTEVLRISSYFFCSYLLAGHAHDFRSREHQLGLAGDQADDGAEQHHPVADPHPAHQRIHVHLQDDVVVIRAGPGVIDIEVFVQAAPQRDF